MLKDEVLQLGELYGSSRERRPVEQLRGRGGGGGRGDGEGCVGIVERGQGGGGGGQTSIMPPQLQTC